MNEFVAYPSPWRRAQLCLGGIGLFLAALWLIGVFGPPPTSQRYSREHLLLAGWLGILFFGPGTLIMATRIFDKDETLRIDEHGIRYTSWSSTIIQLNDIKDVRMFYYRRSRYIVLRLRDPSRYSRRGFIGIHYHMNRMMTGGGDVSISLADTNGNLDDAMAAISRIRYARPAVVHQPPRRFGNRSVG